MEFKEQLASALVLNIVLKFVTFALTTTLTRQLTPDENGINFSLQVYFNTVLFLARESVRSVSARYNVHDVAGRGAMVLQVMHCAAASIPVGIAVMATLELLPWCGIHVFPSLATISRVGDSAPLVVSATAGGVNSRDDVAFGLPELFLVLSVLIALLIEPCISLAQSFDCVRAVVASEFWALLARVVVTLTFIWALGGLGGTSWTVRICFASGILAYAIVTLGYFLWLWNVGGGGGGSAGVILQRARADAATVRWGGGGGGGAPRSSSSSSSSSPLPLRMRLPWCFFSWRAARRVVATQELLLFFQFFQESCLRLLLAEGGRFALVAFGSATAMGHYELITSLGSLVARLVFRVWENACFVKWSRDMATGHVDDAVALLFSMLRVASYFGAVVVLVGPPLAKVFLLQLFSYRWTSPEAVLALQLYCYLLPPMAWYGLLDAFARARASPSMLRLMQQVMVVQAALYVATCFVVLRLRWIEDAVVGLIVVNGTVTMLRCVSSLCILLWTPKNTLQQQQQRQIKLKEFAAVFDTRIVKMWAILFICTRWAMVVSSTFGAVAALLAALVFATSVMWWDPDIRGVVSGLLRA